MKNTAPRWTTASAVRSSAAGGGAWPGLSCVGSRSPQCYSLHGATVRYVTLPHEAHGYAARESNLHVVAETLDWLNKYVKNATPRSTTASAAR